MPSAVGGNAWNLSQGERKNGVESTVLIRDPSQYNDFCDILIKQPKSRVLATLKNMTFCVLNAHKYDVIHYSWGQMLIQYQRFGLFGWDLRYFKKRGKVIAVTFQGSDARQADYCLEHHDITFYTPEDVEAQRANDRFKRRRIEFYAKNADLIYSTNPDLLAVLPENARFRPYTKLQIQDWVPVYSDYEKKQTVIIHAPTKQKVKGTQFVLDAVNRLKSEGYDIDFRLLQNIPNKQVIDFYREADLVIDQLMVGWFGGFAVECMALGKPVMAYLREEDLKYIPEQMRREMPVINVNADTIYSVLKRTLDNKSQLADTARAGRAFCEKWMNSEKIAAEIICDYQRVIDSRKTKRNCD